MKESPQDAISWLSKVWQKGRDRQVVSSADTVTCKMKTLLQPRKPTTLIPGNCLKTAKHKAACEFVPLSDDS